MRRLFCLLALLPLVALGRGPGNHTQDYHQGAKAGQSLATSLSLLAPASVQSSPLFCTAARNLSLLTGSYACLNGDGTQDSSAGMTLSAVGSPTTQTLATSPNGNNSAAVSRQRWTTSDGYQTASLSPPAGDFSVCHVGPVSAPLSAVTLVSGPGYSLTVSSAGVATFTSGGASISSASGAVVGGADQLICGTRSGTSGSVYVGTVATSGTVAAPTGSAVLKVGGFVGASRGAFVVPLALSSTQEGQLHAALIPTPQTASGVAVSNSRNSASWVTTSDGTLVALPPGRTGVVGVPGDTASAVGGVVSSPSRTNLLTYSEQFDNAAWTKTNATVTANSTTAPDGALTADTVTSTVAGGYVSQAVTTSASAYDGGLWVRTTSGTQAMALQLYDATTAAQACISSVTATTTYQRVSCSTAALTSGDSLQWRLYPGGTAGTGTVIAFAAQLETGSIASPYCRSESTSATCSGDVVTVPTPGWLSTKEGCAKVCVTPTWTGSSPSAAAILFLAGTASSGGQILSMNTGSSFLRMFDGSGGPNIAASFSAGVRTCIRATWSASGGKSTLTNLNTNAFGTSAFTTFADFGSSIGIGAGSGGAQPLGSIIDSVTLGSGPGGCQ